MQHLISTVGDISSRLIFVVCFWFLSEVTSREGNAFYPYSLGYVIVVFRVLIVLVVLKQRKSLTLFEILDSV